MLSVVLGIITNANNQLLVALRPAHTTLAGFWEFPGGKIEPAESSFLALKRELTEEIGIVVKEARLLFDFEYQQNDRKLLFNTWQVLEYQGEPRGCEGQQIQWVDIEYLPELKMPSSNQEMWPKIKEYLHQR